MGYWSPMFNDDERQQTKLCGARDVAVELVQQMERDFPDQWIELLRDRMNRNNNITTERDDDNDNRE